MTDSSDMPETPQTPPEPIAPATPGWPETSQQATAAGESVHAAAEPHAASEAPTIPALPETPPAPQYPPAPEQYFAPPGQPPAGYPGQPPYPYADPTAQPRYDYQYSGASPIPGQYPIPGALVPPRRQPPQWLQALARPFPRWIPLVAILVTLALFGVLALLGNDWAQSALFAGIAAGVAFLLLGALTILRTVGGMGGAENPRRVRQFMSAGLALALLFGLFGGAFVLQRPLHRAQAASYEGQKQWQLALTEYKQAGEKTPSSSDLARVYNEWAEESAAQGEYSASIDFFTTVLKTFPGATTQVARARVGLVGAYLAWGKAAVDSKDYQSAAQRLDTLLALDYCDAACKTTAGAADATAYYNLAEAALGAQAYDVAVDKFHSLVQRFPSSPEATQAHADLAKSLLGLGQKQRVGVCSQAVPTYQELSAKFGDTPEGQAATGELAQPQAVIGRFTKAIPGGAYAILAKGMYHNMPHNEFISKVSYPAPRVRVNGDGTFRFDSIAQGTWDLVWATVNGNGESYLFSYRSSDGLSYYQAQVGPLCAYDLGSIDEDFPAGL